MKTQELLGKLKAMAGKAGPAVLERLRMAKEVLSDRAWVVAEDGGGGDEDAARDRLMADCFPELSLGATLGELLTLLDVFPDEADWKRHKYNLRRLWAEYEEKRPKAENGRSTRRTASVKDIQERDEKITSLEYAAKRERDAALTKDQRIAELEAKVADLQRINARLEGRIEELERMTRRPTPTLASA